MYKYIEQVEGIIEDFKVKYSSELKLVEIWYIPKIKTFFTRYMGKSENTERPIDTISYTDINSFLKTFKDGTTTKQNYYNALKKFFMFTYHNKITNDVMLQVKQPDVKSNGFQYISQRDLDIITEYIEDKKSCINERLLIGFFLYTGLSRQYIYSLKNENISTGNIDCSLHYINNKNEYASIPLNDKLINLIREYFSAFKIIKPFEKVFNYDRPEEINRDIEKITKKVIGKKITPTHFSNTFIKRCLQKKGNINEIAHLLSEAVVTISKHNDNTEDEEKLFNSQKKLLNSIYQ